MNTLIILGAKYLWLISPVILLYVFAESNQKQKFVKLGALILPISYLFGLIGRALYFNPRPFVSEGITPLIQHIADNGFPSDHTLLAGAIAALVTIFNRKIGVLLWFVAVLVAVSRVLAGVHHTVDVLASLAISALVGGMIYFFDARKQ